MLLTTLLTQAADDLRWTGEVKAFAYFATAECLPQERLATVYVARKLFADGSTVTVVRNVPSDRLPGLRSATTGQGRIERDPMGTVVRYDAETVLRPHGGSFTLRDSYAGPNGSGFGFGSVKQASQPYPITTLRSEFALDPKTGFLAGSWGTMAGVARMELTQPRSYWLDPLEAIAFGSPALLASGWLLPSATAALYERQSRAIGTKTVPIAKAPYALELDGTRGMFRRIDLAASNPDARRALPPMSTGTLLFHMDGRLAAYVPGFGMGETPGSVAPSGIYGKFGKRDTPPPFALKGKLKEMWDKGLDVRQDQVGVFGLFVPVSVSAQERTTILAGIRPSARDVEPAKEEGPPTEAKTPPVVARP